MHKYLKQSLGPNNVAYVGLLSKIRCTLPADPL